VAEASSRSTARWVALSRWDQVSPSYSAKILKPIVWVEAVSSPGVPSPGAMPTNSSNSLFVVSRKALAPMVSSGVTS
jgi:hypothetical protein